MMSEKNIAYLVTMKCAAFKETPIGIFLSKEEALASTMDIGILAGELPETTKFNIKGFIVDKLLYPIEYLVNAACLEEIGTPKEETTWKDQGMS